MESVQSASSFALDDYPLLGHLYDHFPCTRINSNPPDNMSKDTTKKGFQGALDSIKDAVADLASLDVITFRGTVTGDASGIGSWDDVMTRASGASGSISLALATHVEFDCDTRTFVSNDVPPQWIIDAHAASVQAGLDARESIISLIGDTLKGLIKKT